jgi:hypothetical protein
MLGVRCMPNQPSLSFDDVSNPLFDRAVEIVIPFHILDSVLFQLPKSLITWNASHELLDSITVFEPWEMQSGVSIRQPSVIVNLYSLLLDPTLDIFVQFTRRKLVLGIVLKVHLKATLCVVYPWLGNVIAPRSAGTQVYFCPRQKRWQWFRLQICDVVNVFEVGKRSQVFD